jgi:V8-like Glu-specific endopeptidase
VAPRSVPIIYGSDSRVEASDFVQGPPWRLEAVNKAVALFPKEEADDGDGGVDGGAAEDELLGQGLCPEERFIDQPSFAECSGVLLEENIVLTAGHCFRTADTCSRYTYVLGYTEEADDEAVVARACTRTLLRELGNLKDGSRVDYAFVELAAQSRPDGSSRDAGELSEPRIERGTKLVTLGYPDGRPLKIDLDATATDVGSTDFGLRTDAFRGSSGSGVYNLDGKLVGILTNGQVDYSWDSGRQCFAANTVSAAMSDAEERALFASVAISRACAQGVALKACAQSAPGSVMSKEVELPSSAEPVSVKGRLRARKWDDVNAFPPAEGVTKDRAAGCNTIVPASRAGTHCAYAYAAFSALLLYLRRRNRSKDRTAACGSAAAPLATDKAHEAAETHATSTSRVIAAA